MQKTIALGVIDVQEKLFPLVERAQEIASSLQLIIRGCDILSVPIIYTEQSPEKLGKTLTGLLLPEAKPLPKTKFSAADVLMKNSKKDVWVLCGIEAHVCIFQTARDLVSAGKSVIVLNDAISSRSIYDYSTAIAEMRDIGCRISSVETILFELLEDANSPKFKEISQLIKCASKPVSCCMQ